MSGEERKHWVLETCSATILGVTALATAWSGFQATRWNGVQSERYGAASAQRVESTRASAQAGQAIMIDVGMFLNWIDAVAAHDTVRANFLRDRFRPPFRQAFDVWLATAPLDSVGPTTPFATSEYRLPKLDEAERLEKRAARTFEEGQSANDRSDRYMFVTVILASSLFLASIAHQFRRPRLQVVMTVAAGFLCLAGLVMLMLLPVD